jgi:hypothetical protein
MINGFAFKQLIERIVSPSFAGADGRFAASSHPRFAPIAQAIGLARDARIHPQTGSSSLRDLATHTG